MATESWIESTSCPHAKPNVRSSDAFVSPDNPSTTVMCVLMPSTLAFSISGCTRDTFSGLLVVLSTSESALSSPNLMPMQPASAMRSSMPPLSAIASVSADQRTGLPRRMISVHSDSTHLRFALKLSSSKYTSRAPWRAASISISSTTATGDLVLCGSSRYSTCTHAQKLQRYGQPRVACTSKHGRNWLKPSK